MLKFYGYKKCSTSNKAEAFLKKNQIPYEFIDITQTTPSKQILKKAINLQPQRKSFVFNTSGVVYREKNVKNILSSLSFSQTIDLLSSEGRLIKRPFLCDQEKITIGFNELQFREQWLT